MKKKDTQMTESTTEQAAAPTKGARKGVARAPQKVYAILTCKDANGNELDMREGKGYEVTLTLSKDHEGVIKMLLNGAQAYVSQVEVPKANAADEDEAAA